MLARFTCRWHNYPTASRLSLLAGVCLVLLGGCLAKPGPREDETTMDFRHIARVYESIQSFNNRPPRDLEEIKKYLADYHTDGLVEEPDKVLTSSRDGLPYVIVLGAQFGGTEDEIIFYEQRGADGQRYVMTTGRVVQKMTDEEFRQARFANQHRPEST